MSEGYDYKKYAVLYVDDEEQALKYFRKGFDKEFQVLTAASVADACVILERESATIGVVLTDQRMPGQFGVELLKRIRTQWPAIVRILITAYSDIESAIESVNSGALFRYLTKPADMKLVKETVKSAMELFLNNRQRETLLSERLDVMQRMVVADRVRSLASMAGGISHHLRNSMTALTCFLEETASAKPGEAPNGLVTSDPKFAQQLWTLANQERERLLQIVQTVGQTVAEPSFSLSDEIDPAELLRRGIEAAAGDTGDRPVAVSVAPGLAKMKVDATAATRLLRILLTYAARLSKLDGKLNAAINPATVSGSPGFSIHITGEGAAWSESDVASFFTPFAFPASDPSDLGLDLLAAFSIAYHHGGDVIVHPAAPAGPGFELRLPANPASIRRPELQNGLTSKLFAGLQDPPAGGKAA